MYEVSILGHVRRARDELPMVTSMNKQGALKVSLMDEAGTRWTAGVHNLVATAFVEKPFAETREEWPLPHDYVLHKDRDRTNNRAWNLVWRTKRHTMLYYAQFKELTKAAYEGPVVNLTWDLVYTTVLEAAMAEGLLVEEILKCLDTDNGNYRYGYYATMPEMCVFQRYGTQSNSPQTTQRM